MQQYCRPLYNNLSYINIILDTNLNKIIHLLHCYFRISLEGPFKSIFQHHLKAYCICITLLILAVTIILSRDIVTKYLNKFTDGVYDLIFKQIPS
ncbi:hypothetical protein [Methanobrevibacter sp.]|uniref:hypothetical protein n=1 Tax=Methanobrevibacter sp. TaxID=66852 RepID=UPI0025F50A8D|nr:hypothetical protein [Methanobrevibacter sp.]